MEFIWVGFCIFQVKYELTFVCYLYICIIIHIQDVRLCTYEKCKCARIYKIFELKYVVFTGRNIFVILG